MYIALPIQLRFLPDKEKHTVAVFEKFKDKQIDLTCHSQAVIAETYDEALARLKKEVRESCKFIESNKTEARDWELYYRVEPVTDGKFWCDVQNKQSTYLESPYSS